jgi:tripartite-type tricarboxylate transporter receptor subunit TctC
VNSARRCSFLLVLIAAAISLVALDQAAWSQATRTIKIVVPTPPGGVADIAARLLAEQIGRAQSLTIVIENRPGAEQVIGTEAVARAAPDGNTLEITPVTFVLNPLLRKVNYDPFTSFDPICELVSAPTVIAVNSASPYRTLADLLNAARAKPGDLTLASTGPAFRIGFEMFKRTANVDMTFVAYPGMAPAVNALLGEHVTSIFGTYQNVAEHLKARTLRALATGSQMRIEPLLELPTVSESGYKDWREIPAWFGLLAPAKTPKDRLSQLADWFTAAMQAPEVKAKLVAQGVYPVAACGEEFSASLRRQYDDARRVIREANIKAE